MPGRKDGRVRPADWILPGPGWPAASAGNCSVWRAGQMLWGRGWIPKARYSTLSGGFQVALEVKNLPANAGDMGLIPVSGRCPGEWQPTPVFLPGKSHGQSLVGYSPCCPKSWTQLSSAQVPT